MTPAGVASPEPKTQAGGFQTRAPAQVLGQDRHLVWASVPYPVTGWEPAPSSDGLQLHAPPRRGPSTVSQPGRPCGELELPVPFPSPVPSWSPLRLTSALRLPWLPLWQGIVRLLRGSTFLQAPFPRSLEDDHLSDPGRLATDSLPPGGHLLVHRQLLSWDPFKGQPPRSIGRRYLPSSLLNASF